MSAAVLDPDHWDRQYRDGPAVWDTGEPAAELCRVIHDLQLRPCRAIELGCGSGTNTVWLASQGFTLTGFDLSEEAISRARERARLAAVSIDFHVASFLDARTSSPFDFFLDCGCYHAVRLADRPAYFAALDRLLSPGGLGLVLTGNDAEPEDPKGPPVLGEEDLRSEWGRDFVLLELRSFRWDARPGAYRYLGWSCLVQNKRT